MSALEKILKWANQDIPAWQADAIKRFLTSEELTDCDKNELYLMMKVHAGLIEKTEDTPSPQLPTIDGISGSAKPGDSVCLKSVKCIENVNAIPDQTELPVGHEGVTVIYGENGSGKSGFARVLKRACNARDRKDEVLGNIFGANFAKKPKVTFKLDINDNKDTFHDWHEGLQDSSTLSKIAVFDSKCARIIIDNRNEYHYKPYGTSIFEELVKLCEEFKQILNKEIPQTTKPALPNIIIDTTAGAFTQNISSKTSSKEFSVYDQWSDENEQRLTRYKDWLDTYKNQNVDEKIAPLKSLLSKYVDLMRETRSISRYFSIKRIESINSLIIEYNTAAEAQKIAEKAVDESEFPLSGVKTNPWRLLFEAAEKYSTSCAYPNEEFPVTSENARCVLCMQTLDVDAKKRLRTFKEFILDAVGARLKKANSDIENVSNIFDRYHIRTLKDVELHTSDLPKEYHNISEEISEFFTAFHVLLKSIQNNLKNRATVGALVAPEISYERIFTWLKGIKKQISDYESLKNPEEAQKHQNAYNELFSQKLVHENIQSFKEFVTTSQKAAKYITAINALDTTKISKKGRTLISEECTPELQAYLQKEFDSLGIRNIDIIFKPRGSKGVTLHELEFQDAAAKHLPSKILSEGEQKAVALAGFFAELSLAKHTCPIVLDDPVTSLDHNYREKIAQRIAIESSTRQVIVFTHDIVFLHEIEKHLGRVDGNLSIITLKKVGTIPGKVFSTQPWHSMKVKERLAYLEEIIPKFSNLYEDNLSEYNDKAAQWYNLFRETWEAIVEENLLAGAVQKFNKDVKTQNLKMIEITDDDYKTVDLNMSKASEWMYGHNRSKPQTVNRPSPKELRDELIETRSFISQIKSRSKSNQKRREEKLKPKQTVMG